MLNTKLLRFMLNTSAFHCSATVWQRPTHTLYNSVDWSRIEGGEYAVVDPMDSHAILYLSERAYQVQVRVSMSQDSNLIVLARPGDKKVSNIFNESDQSQNSPQLRSSKWKKFLNWSISRVRSLASIDENGRALVTPSREILMSLIPWWGLTTSYWAGGSITPKKGLRRAVFQMARSLATILVHQGKKSLILKMKNSLFLLNRALARQEGRDPWLLGHPVGLAGGKLPRIIPLALRRRILSGDIIAIRVVQSILQGYKAFEGPYEFQKLENITGGLPFQNPDTLAEFQIFCKETFWEIVARYAGKDAERLLNPSLKLSESASPYVPLRGGPNNKSGILGSVKDALAWSLAPVNWIVKWCEHVDDNRTLLLIKSVTKAAEKLWPFCKDQLHLGKIGLLPEPAGKVRTIAIVDYWTQRVMHPMHIWMFDVLKVLPTDATFSQEGSLRSYRDLNLDKHWSIDLKSATDMIPITLYEAVFKGVLPDATVDLWVSLLTDRYFHVPRTRGDKFSRDGKPKSLAHSSVQGTDVLYGRGQPMGTLSSWASMSIVHHALELFAAQKAGENPYEFTKYRILGDDNVTGCESVANHYKAVTDQLGVPISMAKTLEGELFQFASQVFWRGVNISPLSLREEIGIESSSQRLEQALRAARRGWTEVDGTSKLSRFLRVLLPVRAYKRSLVEFTKGKLGLLAQSALIFSLGASGSLMRALGYQATGSTPFLLAIANKVEALAGDKARLSREVNSLLGEIEYGLILRTVSEIQREVSRLSKSLLDASKRFGDWREGIHELGVLPRSYRITPGWTGHVPVILDLPWPSDRDNPRLRFFFARNEVPDEETFMELLAEPSFYEKVLSTLPLGERRKAKETFMGACAAYLYPFWVKHVTKLNTARAEALAEIRILHPALWLVIEDTYAFTFGLPVVQGGFTSDYDYLEAEDDGMGMSFTEDPINERVAPSGLSAYIPKVQQDLSKLGSELQVLIEELEAVTPEKVRSTVTESLWTKVDEAAGILVKMSRLPSFLSLEDFCPERSRKEINLQREWGRKVEVMRNLVNTWPLDVEIKFDAAQSFEGLNHDLERDYGPLYSDSVGVVKTNKVALTGSPKE